MTDTETATCWTLIDAAALGDGSARESFARLYQPIAKLYFAARWRQSPCLSQLDDDAVQEVFIQCFKPAGVLEKIQLNRPDGFRAYLYGVLKNVARRHEANHLNSEPLDEEVPADDTSISHAFDRAWAQSLLREAARLQAELAKQAGERAVKRVELLRLRFQEGLAIRDIASKWNADAAVLHHEYAKARDEFRIALRQLSRLINRQQTTPN